VERQRRGEPRERERERICALAPWGLGLGRQRLFVAGGDPSGTGESNGFKEGRG